MLKAKCCQPPGPGEVPPFLKLTPSRSADPSEQDESARLADANRRSAGGASVSAAAGGTVKTGGASNDKSRGASSTPCIVVPTLVDGVSVMGRQ